MAEKRMRGTTALRLPDLAGRSRQNRHVFAPAELHLGKSGETIVSAALQEEFSREGNTVYRLGAIGLVSCLAVCSCAALNPKNWSWFSGQKGKNPPEQHTTIVPDGQTVPPPPAPPGRPTSTQGNGVLAGQVIDGYRQRRPYALIQVSLADGGDSPREVQTDAQGYFVVQGLKPGQRYKLVAKARLGEKVLTGVTYATPPNVVVNIVVREDLSEGEPSGVPPNNAARGPDNNARPAGTPQSWRAPIGNSPEGNPWTPAGWRSGKDGWKQGSETPATPAIPVHAPAPSVAPGVSQLPAPPVDAVGSGPAPGQSSATAKANVLPLAQITNPIAWPGAAPHSPSPATPPSLSVPGCRMVANRLEDFALLDLNGEVFQWRQSPARLTLLDFWGTWCRPCMNSLPHLVDLQRRYAARGLQVIGIAYEDGSLAEQRQRVNFVRQRLGLNYRVLLGNGENCPVKNSLGVQSFPTLVLLDEQGNILWRAEGLDSSHLLQLENEIRRRLN